MPLRHHLCTCKCAFDPDVPTNHSPKNVKDRSKDSLVNVEKLEVTKFATYYWKMYLQSFNIQSYALHRLKLHVKMYRENISLRTEPEIFCQQLVEDPNSQQKNEGNWNKMD